MTAEDVRGAIALVVVGVFMLIMGFMAIYPLLTPTEVDLNGYSEFFLKTAGIYTGIVGVIIGYYFGRVSRGPSETGPIERRSP